MENKSNQATPQRPEGDRILNAPLVTVNIDHFIEQVKSEPAWRDSDRNSITVFKSDEMRIVLIGLHEGAELKTHTANGMISVQVLEGQIKFTAEPQITELTKGQMVVLQKKVPHSVLALQHSFFLLTLCVE